MVEKQLLHGPVKEKKKFIPLSLVYSTFLLKFVRVKYQNPKDVQLNLLESWADSTHKVRSTSAVGTYRYTYVLI